MFYSLDRATDFCVDVIYVNILSPAFCFANEKNLIEYDSVL